jgi:hypothetical protein
MLPLALKNMRLALQKYCANGPPGTGPAGLDPQDSKSMRRMRIGSASIC